MIARTKSEDAATTPADRASVFVVVPAYNEGPCLEQVLGELRATYPNVVVVDDGSTDDTSAVAKRCGATVLRHLLNRGQGAALQTGVEYVLARQANVVVSFDADGQHRVEDIEKLLLPIERGECEVTLGSRFLGETVDMPSSRRRALRLAILFTWLVNGVKLTDAHNGLRAFSRRAAEELCITHDRMAHASELIDWIRRSRLSFREVPVQIRYTPYSLAKGQSVRDGFRIVIQYFLGKVGR